VRSVFIKKLKTSHKKEQRPGDLGIFLLILVPKKSFSLEGGGHTVCVCVFKGNFTIILMPELQSAITSADFFSFFSSI